MNALSKNLTQKLIDFAYEQSSKKTYHITRLSMYKALGNALLNLDDQKKSCLAIGGSAAFTKILGLHQTKLSIANYPEYNILDLKFESNIFDFCVSDQVLEHVEGDPFLAFSETARVIKPGGYVCHTTCFINKVHGVPKDFWRFTLDSLSLLASKSGLDVEILGGWGNRDAMALIESQYRFKPIPDDPKNPIYQLAMQNEIDWPITVWVLARKPN